jgi:hypothetical protein
MAEITRGRNRHLIEDGRVEISIAGDISPALHEVARVMKHGGRLALMPSFRQDRSAARSGARTTELGTIGGSVFVWLGDLVKPGRSSVRLCRRRTLQSLLTDVAERA